MVDNLIKNYPVLEVCRKDISDAFELLRFTYDHQGLVLACGNGGSAADAEHMVAELMKTFNLERPLPENLRRDFIREFGDEGTWLAKNLQCSLKAISLVSQTSLATAIGNDVSADLIFAQQVIGYGQPGDLLFAISTSGNSHNILNAVYTARVMELKVIGLTGRTGGKMKKHCDATICVPADDTPRIQELHMPVYHTLCAMLEKHFFG
ncbi:MAG: phosphoheptose isomerase [Bacteroides sp. SM23_62_1]|nr:MAG: phosphoheptose isomerase [Bacteroides sp. SM23_62_1]